MTTQQQRTASVAAQGDRQIRIEREFDAPRARVFAAMTNPELIPDWWGPHKTTTVVEKMEPHTGGDWCFRVHDPEQGEMTFRGTYREVTPPERIVQTFEWSGMPGYVSVETMELEDLGDRTRIVTTSTFFFPEERDGMIASGMEQGLSETYERLDEVLARTA